MLEENQCESNMDETVRYYEENAAGFIEATIGADVSKRYDQFENSLTPGCRILVLAAEAGATANILLSADIML